MAGNNYKKAISDAQLQIDLLIKKVEQLDDKLLKLNKSAASGGGNISGLKSVNEELKKKESLIDRINRVSKTQSSTVQKLNEKQILQERRLMTQINKRFDASKKAEKKAAELSAKKAAQMKKEEARTRELSRAYNKLTREQKRARDMLRDAIVSGNKSASTIALLQKRYDGLTKRVNKANAATQNFSKSGLGGAMRGIRNLLGAFGFAGLAYIFADMVRDVFALTKKLQSLDFALKTITADTNNLTEASSELYAAQSFLLDISTRYGLNILTTTERFTKFLAAAKQSNIAFSETKRIFESVSKASAVLGLRTDELNGVYLALEQMISKGKVTTEELRRQLGERLPGAFGIMADAMDVSIVQLDKMLKKGEVLSADALPKFATALEKAYGIETVRTVDTLVASQNRLTVAWISFVRTVEGSENALSNTFKALLDEITFALNFWEDALSSDVWKNVKAQQKAQTEAFEAGSNYIDKITQGLSTELQMTQIQNMLDANKKERDSILKSIDDIQGKDEQGNIKIKLSEGENAAIDILLVKLASLKGTASAYTMALESLLDVKNANNEEDEKGIKILKGSKAWYEKQISLLEETRDKQALTVTEYNRITDAIEKLKKSLDTLETAFEIQEFEGKKIEIEPIVDYDEWEKAKKYLQDFWKDYTKTVKRELDKQEKASKELVDGLLAYQERKSKAEAFLNNAKTEQRIELFKTVTDTFGEFYDLDFDKFTFLMDEKENTTAQWADASKEIINGVLNASMRTYELELQEAIRSRDLILNNELASDEQKRLAKERFEQKEAEIKTRRAKAEKTNALIGIAVDTASSVVKASSYLSNPVTALLHPAIVGTIIGIGAVQAALVASQKIPKFAEGHLSGTHQGAALINDANRSDYKEIVERKKGGIEVYSDRNQLIDMQKGDKVHKNMESLMSNFNMDDVFMMNVMADGRQLSQSQMLENSMFTTAIEDMKQEFKLTAREMKQLAKRPVQVSNRVTVEQPFTKYE